VEWLEFLQGQWWVVVFAFVLSLGSLLLLPLIVLKLPVDYFRVPRRQSLFRSAHGAVVGVALVVAKNLIGLILLLLGFAMLVLPGQGIATMLAGLVLLDFPGKFYCERWLVSRGRVFDALNWLRAKRGKLPLRHPYR
jgi:hypothetical protein